MPEREYTYEEASRSTGVPVSTLRYMANHGTLEIRRIHARRVSISASEVERVKRLATEHKATPDDLRDTRIANLERRISLLEAQFALNTSRSMIRVEPDGTNRTNTNIMAIAHPEPSDSHATRTYTPFQRSAASLPILSSVRNGVPPGSMSVSDFAAAHGVPRTTLVSQVNDGYVTFTNLAPGASRRSLWLAPSQQAAVITHWQAVGTPHTPCPNCPHGEADEAVE